MNWFQKWLLKTFTPDLARGVRRRIERMHRRGYQYGYMQGLNDYFQSLPLTVMIEHTIAYNILFAYASGDLDKWVTQEPLDESLPPPDAPTLPA